MSKTTLMYNGTPIFYESIFCVEKRNASDIPQSESPFLEQNVIVEPRILHSSKGRGRRVSLKYENKSNQITDIHCLFEEFSNDFMSLLNDSSSSDITIKSGSQTLKVHKLILSARSRVFKAMFNNPMRESIEGTISIDDLDSQTVLDLMHFIYSSKVQNLCVPKAFSLLDASEKYELNSLKRVCVDFLVANLSVENAFLILQKADLYDKELKLSAIKFIKDNFSVLRKTKEWEAMQSHSHSLALEVLNFIVDDFI